MPNRVLHALVVAVLLPCAGMFPSPAPAQSHPEPEPETVAEPIRDVAAVVVSGAMPGPGLWQVTRGDHVMWVLGTQAPLPKRMQWHSGEVDEAMAASQELIHAPVMGITFEAGGFFKSLFLVPKVYGARKNPDGATLQDILPAELHARWLPLRERYLGRGRKAEGMRPVFAAGELWTEALDEEGLVEGGIVGPVIERAVKAHGLRETRPRWVLKITDAKAVLAEVEHANLNDVECLEATIRELESGPERLRQRANAWASGDMATLRALPDAGRRSACSEAVMESPALLKRGGGNIDEEIERTWLEAAEKALANNSSTFALLPLSNLLSDDGYLQRLAERGYTVIPPGP